MRIIILLMIILSVLLISCSVSEKRESKITELNETPGVSKPNTSDDKIACYADSNCGVRRAENAYCFQGEVVGDLYEWICENPGTASARCVESHKNGIISECTGNYFCNKGECVKYSNCNDTDGGMNFKKAGKVITNDMAVYEDYCKKNDVLVEYYCSSDDRAFSETEDCKCERGACINP